MRIEIAGLEFSYESVPVLEDINLELKEGETLAIVGPNASGKTTLLKCINRILEPQKGTILIDGEELKELGKEEIARKIGHVPQAEAENFPTTVFDTVLMGRKPHGGWKPSKKDLEIASEIIEKLNLEEISMRNIGEISGGQRQKVMIARCLAQEPEAILLDEPTSSLDLRHKLEVLNSVKEQAQEGISVVMAMHDLNLALRYSDKILMLREGKIFAAGGPEIITPENIETVYGVKVKITEESGRYTIMPEEPVD